MNIYENNKQLLTAMGGDSANLATDFEVRKAILQLLGGDTSTCNSIYEVDKQILNIYLEGGGGTGGDCDLTPITITENGVYSREIGGYSEVTVNVEIPECPEIPLTAITINSNGTYIPEEGGYNEVVVDVDSGGAGGGEKAKVLKLDIDDTCIVDGTWGAESIDTSLMTSFNALFYGCKSLTQLDVSNWDVSNVKDMTAMFSGCKSLTQLDVSNWDVSNVNIMRNIFYQCSSLQSLDLTNWDVSNVNDMVSMFGGCKSLQSVDVSGWNTSKVTDMYGMFINCSSLQTLDVSGWDTRNVTTMSNMFYDCNKLTTLIGGRTIDEVLSDNISALNGLKKNISLDSTILDRASLRALINGLADLTGSTSQTLTLGSTLKAKLTEEDIAVATAKNWTIA